MEKNFVNLRPYHSIRIHVECLHWYYHSTLEIELYWCYRSTLQIEWYWCYRSTLQLECYWCYHSTLQIEWYWCYRSTLEVTPSKYNQTYKQVSHWGHYYSGAIVNLCWSKNRMFFKALYNGIQKKHAFLGLFWSHVESMSG